MVEITVHSDNTPSGIAGVTEMATQSDAPDRVVRGLALGQHMPEAALVSIS
jgi:hypothetical protein